MPRNRAWSPLEGLERAGWYVGTPGMSQIALMPVICCDVTQALEIRWGLRGSCQGLRAINRSLLRSWLPRPSRNGSQTVFCHDSVASLFPKADPHDK